MKMKTVVSRCIAPVVLLAACAGYPLLSAATEPATANGTDLPAAAPEAVGVDSALLVRMSEWIRNDKLDVRSLLVLEDGKLIFERYSQGLTRDHNYELYSVTKTVSSLLTGILVGEDKLKVPNVAMLRPEHYEAAHAELDGLLPLAEQHLARMIALDRAFIEAVLRPAVSIRKVRALARRQARQGDQVDLLN